MSKKALGIDIGDGWLALVELTRQGKSLRVSACHGLPFAADTDLGETLGQLLAHSGQADICVCGLPLTMIGIRNLSLPFKEAKSIAQTLPFELEEQLLAPMERQVADFSLVEIAEAGSRVIAFAVEKTVLGGLLECLQGVADPETVMPSAVALAMQIARFDKGGRSLLHLHLEAQGLTMALITGTTPILYRRIPLPEQLVLPPMAAEPVAAAGADQAVERGLGLLCGTVERTIDFFRLEHRIDFQPEVAVFTGPGVAFPALIEQIGRHLGLAVESPDLWVAAGIEDPNEDLRDEWQARRGDGALALALHGLGKRTGISFRKAEFARKPSLRAVRKQAITVLAAAALLAVGLIGYLAMDYRRLHNRDRALKEEMTAIYKQTFPSVTTVREPHAEMLAAMKGLQGTDAPAPILVRDKRVLALLADISTRIPTSVQIQVSRLFVDHESVQIKGVTDTFNAVETIKSTLAASSRFGEVRIVSATADKGKGKEGGLIRFELQLQLRGV